MLYQNSFHQSDDEANGWLTLVEYCPAEQLPGAARSPPPPRLAPPPRTRPSGRTVVLLGWRPATVSSSLVKCAFLALFVFSVGLAGAEVGHQLRRHYGERRGVTEVEHYR